MLGAVVWAKNFGGTGADLAYGVAVDPLGGVVVVGYYSPPSTNFLVSTCTNLGAFDAFVLKLGSDGAPAWVQCFRTAGNDLLSSVATDAGGNVLVVGALPVPWPGGGPSNLPRGGLLCGQPRARGGGLVGSLPGHGPTTPASGVAVDAAEQCLRGLLLLGLCGRQLAPR
jgi:hypothetical protein